MSIEVKVDCGEPIVNIPVSIFKNNRSKVVDLLKTPEVPKKSVILVHGGNDMNRAECDFEYLFRQESSFYYLFGAKEPGCMGIIDVDTKKSILLIPHLAESYAIWMGKIQPPSYFKELYGVDECRFTEDVDLILSEMDPSVVYLNHGLNTDSGNYAQPASFSGIEKFRTDKGKLYPCIADARVEKTEEEIKVYRYVNRKAAEAQMYVMANCKPGMYEYQLEAMFNFASYFRGGCRNVAFVGIAASGTNASVLHYGHAGAPNDKKIENGDIVVNDMGCEYKCFVSDITRSFPANGKYTDDQKIIYNAVLDMQNSVIKAMKPGVSWVDMHGLSLKVGLEHLKKAGILVGDVNEMMEKDVMPIFMPHGLGHLMGHDTHDVGGYSKDVKRPTKKGFAKLRNGKVLQPGMLITVEPGIYFIKFLLDQAKADPVISKFLNLPVLARFENFGGVRIEDDIYITKTGIENLTLAPKSVEDIEAVMAGKLTKVEQVSKST